ncbi:hypothetical protein [Bradyrhizobium sp.]|uniref:hypothetical protein n=1 Tax=Bradyrhizobium sp. TaxID=376 RepID=UPI00261912E6|nr:hypothetical protein [Bradyrhizobium sp.]
MKRDLLPPEEYDPFFAKMRKPKRRRSRKPTLKSVAKQAASAGITVDHYEVGPDGRIIIVPANATLAQNLKTDGHNNNCGTPADLRKLI